MYEYTYDNRGEYPVGEGKWRRHQIVHLTAIGG